MEKVYAEVHYHDAKGRQYRLDRLADELKSNGIEVTGSDFNDDYDGYVEVEITKLQAVELDKKYGSKLYIIGKGNTIEEIFDDALRIEKLVNEVYGK